MAHLRVVSIGLFLASMLAVIAVPGLGREPRRLPEDQWSGLLKAGLPAVAGYSYAVHRNGKLIDVGAAGLRRPTVDSSPAIELRPNASVQFASVSKPITAIALLRLLERKSISVDSPFYPHVAKVMGKISPAAGIDAITFAQLLSHRSGFGFGYARSTRLDSLRQLLQQPLVQAPGSARVYSNVNYAWVRTAIEAISGQAYGDFVQREIFRPAGAGGMTLSIPASDAVFAFAVNDEQGAALALDFEDEAGPYGWYGTPDAMARVLDRIQQGSYLTAELQTRMLAEGLGWTDAPVSDGTAYRHDGQWVLDRQQRGIRTGVALLPGGVTAVLFVNTNAPFSPSAVILRAYRAWRQQNPKAPSWAAAASESALLTAVPPIAHDEHRYRTSILLPHRTR